MTHITIAGYEFRPMDEQAAVQISTWRYPPPYDVYSGSDSDSFDSYLNPDYRYYSVWQNGKLVAFRCFGADAQVPGGDYSADALDMGGGLRPDLTGLGLGTGLMSAAFEFAIQQFDPLAFRATVAGFNLRAQAVCKRVGYVEVERFTNLKSGREFVIFWKAV